MRAATRSPKNSLSPIEPSVAAKDIEEVVLVADVEDQAAAPQRQRRIRAAGRRRGLLVAKLELDADRSAEEVAQPPAPTDLIVESERAVVAREGPECADFELVRTLADTKGRKGDETEQKQWRPRAHVSPGVGGTPL